MNDTLLAFFRRSYGDQYAGDREYENRYLRYKTDVLETKYAKSILVGNRIVCVGTDPSSDRMREMTALLTTIKHAYPDAWMSIGIQFAPMKHAASLVQMKRIQDEHVITQLLAESDTGESYFCTKNKHGVVIHRPTRKNYFQEIYQ